MPKLRAMTVKSIRKFWRKILRIGPLYSAQLALSYLFPSALVILNAVVIVERNPQQGRPAARDDPNARWAVAEDADLFAKTHYSATQFRDRLQRGHRCVIIEADNDLIGYSWYVADSFDQSDWLCVKLPRGAVWGSDIWVAPEFRGQGTDSRIKAFVSSEFEKIGVTKIVSLVDVLNRSSLKAHQKIGTRIHGRLFYFRILGLTVAHTKGALRLGRWNPDRRYELDLVEFLAG